MSPLRLGPNSLLEYSTRYKVLICLQCQYAIQKSALQSHLLRHKIYRDERQRLLDSIAQLELLEPDNVPLPNPDSPPIAALPIISGFRCIVAGCGNLCASEKRMRRHWSEKHGVGENSESLRRPVKLQTFFRGTKLRYFEVTPLGLGDAAGVSNFGSQMHDLDTATPIPPPHLSTPSQPFQPGINLETLTYFHHFTSSTISTLPDPDYWHTNIIPQALRSQWLMCGLLSITASHMSLLAEGLSIALVHRSRSTQFFSGFSAGWGKNMSAEIEEVEEEVKFSARRIRCIIKCTQWATSTPKVDEEDTLQSILTAIKDFVVPASSPLHPNSLQSNHNDTQKDSFTLATSILKIPPPTIPSSASPPHNNDPANLPILLSHLSTLPTRMTTVFSRPSSTHDVLSTLSAIAALIECSASSFASNSPTTIFWGMASWLTKVPERFLQMVEQGSLASMVVLAHWVVLVERAERRGCWFLKGVKEIVIEEVIGRCPVDDQGIWSLFADVRGIHN
ncbi:hypothetical protein GQ43DRAFT_415904 [Delitschia confertaspora ATCC 74209]|uniref:C2H2-type domain-containing protein n=1 Tax=Delitschia confertaspora ATCC 74209 TaxID=1513339 RepID=A0A9P4MVR8_9PLEO|nr:hypothetical protein GQ43DRAFT_415904 [Delitschia confertaspora ATCC 74209]